MESYEDLQPTHADLRSPSHASKRSAKQSQKYYAFRSGPMSRIGQPILSISDDLMTHYSVFLSDPLLIYPEAVRVRTWTKRDQFAERTLDIWPFDRKDHKVGRKSRGRMCDYVPPRWRFERSMKGRGGLVYGDELEMEEEGAEDAASSLDNGRFWDDRDADAEGTLAAANVVPPLAEDGDAVTDVDYDMLSDLASEAEESDWEIIIV